MRVEIQERGELHTSEPENDIQNMHDDAESEKLPDVVPPTYVRRQRKRRMRHGRPDIDAVDTSRGRQMMTICKCEATYKCATIVP